MKKLLFTAHVILMLGLVSCNQKAEPKQEAMPAASEPKKMEVKLSQLASNKDFSCGMDLDEGSIADTASYEGKLYGFCSTECKADFLKDPAKHLAQK